MANADLSAVIEAMTNARILCVGDAIVDHYVWGRIDRISPEAPVPVLEIEREERRPGGAANVLRNLCALGCDPYFISVAGSDAAGHELASMIASIGPREVHLLHEAQRRTTVKTRFIAEAQQLLRADWEQCVPLQKGTKEELLETIGTAAGQYRHVVLSDYSKGFFADGVAQYIIGTLRRAGAVVVVDPKRADYSAYRGAHLLKPNKRELAAAAGRVLNSEEDIVLAARKLMSRYSIDAMLITCGKDGMILAEEMSFHRLPATAREVYDVTGAGDTVGAVLSASLAAGASLLEAATLANEAAGIVVGKVGTAVVGSYELTQALFDREIVRRSKVLPVELALDRVARWRRSGLEIGFANGCFDLLHPGHVSLLKYARASCDRLVVGLNNDNSVRRLKGPSRPVQGAEARAAVLASLADVDLVVLFEEDTPLKLIEAIRPSVLVKGSDYSAGEIVGADFVESYGGRVELAPLLAGHSTSRTITRSSLLLASS
jgi:D-beta-D-heptose 7-phosphate kinase/D-beta-D-heptose 1-phosphate adenosyltransferase